MYFQEKITINNVNFTKVRKLYGILKNFKMLPDYSFEITNENNKFKLTTCSFLILLSMCGLSDTFTIKLWGQNSYILREFSRQIEKIS